MYRDKNDMVIDSFHAFLVDGADFTLNYELPIIRSDMVAKKPPKSIMPFDKAYNYHGDLSEVFVCFYAQDLTFERIRRNPEKYLSFFKKCAGIIGFDYSIHSDMNRAKQISQANDNLSLTYYYGNQGITIIPNLRDGYNELTNEIFEAMPKKSYISIGTYGFIKTKRAQYEWYLLIKKIISELDPLGIIVYGPLNNPIFDELKNKCMFYIYPSWLSQDRKRRNKYVN